MVGPGVPKVNEGVEMQPRGLLRDQEAWGFSPEEGRGQVPGRRQWPRS